jgi:hypothetical protein
MPKLLSLFLLVSGLALVVYGIGASESLASSFAKFFTGSPTDTAIWLLLGGSAMSVLGLFGLARGRAVI